MLITEQNYKLYERINKKYIVTCDKDNDIGIFDTQHTTSYKSTIYYVIVYEYKKT